MQSFTKRLLYFFLGVVAFVSLLCSIAASSVTNESLMKQGFLLHAQTSHLNVPASRYGDYARGLTQYLNGKTDITYVVNPETNAQEAAFSDKENAHLKDVLSIVSVLKIIRWAGGGLVIGVLIMLYFTQEKGKFLPAALRGFGLSALFLLFVFSALAVWGIVNFDGLFVTFHKVVFTNDLWILNPNTDVLVALMPLPFFTWYAMEILKSMLPVLAMMAVIIAAWLKIGNRAD